MVADEEGGTPPTDGIIRQNKNQKGCARYKNREKLFGKNIYILRSCAIGAFCSP
jgi:hypothetical protein